MSLPYTHARNFSCYLVNSFLFYFSSTLVEEGSVVAPEFARLWLSFLRIVLSLPPYWSVPFVCGSFVGVSSVLVCHCVFLVFLVSLLTYRLFRFYEYVHLLVVLPVLCDMAYVLVFLFM